ncbi:MAG: polymer-forming cytoskeletal protein [Deltaproteobacteria bacterium]
MKKEKDDAVSTLLGRDAAFEGNLDFRGAVRLDGKLKGKISSAGGTLIVGEKAMIEADICVDTLIIKGRIHGTVEARKGIEAYPPAHITGNIQAPVISINSGVVFNGTCTMENPTEETAKPS